MSVAAGRRISAQELARVVRGGSFAEVLDAAIAVRGLTLDRLRFHLGERGVDVSVATLSYWRHNKRRPERPESMRAVRVLEEVLGLPPTALITLLGPPKPRGRRVRHAGMPLEQRLHKPDEGQYAVVSAHDVFTVGSDRLERGTWSRLVLRGEHGRVTRCLVRYRADHPQFPPALTGVRFCRAGRIATEPDTGLMVAELLLDRPLGAGEHAVVEYRMAAEPGLPVDNYSRRFREPVAEYSQQIQFEGTLPKRCHSFHMSDFDVPERVVERLEVGPSDSTCFVRINLSAGVIGTRWTW
ncbi:hypothetical protein KALB_5378 [Kutzneria albida DSM 43870]|uniref:Uncharacterized protein n=1 Tax=Kutzneria albida DSM 43870 TaxID=1449976 RepID=W5WDB0_9PSEU|nr:hypothetical protein KALB_5378 [Kutzneria albida DSM 43870]